MKRKINYYSESLVISLCKEIEYIKSRTININHSLKRCQNKLLSERLRIELNNLNNKRINIINISETLYTKNCNDLSLEFLNEMSKRPTKFKQIR